MYSGKRGEFVGVVVVVLFLIIASFFVLNSIGDNQITGNVIGLSTDEEVVEAEPLAVPESIIPPKSIVEEKFLPTPSDDLLNDVTFQDRAIIFQDDLSTSEQISIQSNCGGATSCSCGDTLNESYTMASDLTGCADYGLIIGSPDVILDCDGHTISGTSTGSYSGVWIQPYNNITLRNCTIINFGETAIEGQGIFANGYNFTIENNYIYNCSDGIDINLNGIVSNNIIENLTGTEITGIMVTGSNNNLTIANNIIRNINRSAATSIYGIRLGASNVTVINNDIYDVGNSNTTSAGVYTLNTDDSNISYNNLSSITGSAISLWFSDYNTIDNNIISNISFYGLGIEATSSYNNLSNNNISNTRSYGVYFQGPNNLLYNNSIYSISSGGVYVYSTDIEIISNSIYDTSSIGVAVDSVDRTIISNNTFYNNSVAIYIGGSDSGLISGNSVYDFMDSNVAIYLAYSLYNRLENNYINGENTTATVGIIVTTSSYYNNLTNNEVEKTEQGIYSSSSSQNIFVNNSIHDAQYGFYLTSTGMNQFQGSLINNTDKGMYVGGNSDNNYFIDNHYNDNNYSIDLPGFNYNNTFVNEIIQNSTFFDYQGGHNTQLINLTFNKSKINVTSASGGSAYVKWFVRTKVNNTLGENLQGVNVSAYNNTGGLESSAITNSQGEVLLNLTEFVQDIVSANYVTNHTINASVGGILVNFTNINLSETESISVTLTGNISIPVCGYINEGTTLITDLTSAGDCFIVNESNIVIDGNDAIITGDGTGIGINITNQTNVTIKNLIITNFSVGGYMENATLNNLTGIYINNGTDGLYLYQGADSNYITNNYIQNNSANGTKIINSNNNSIYNNYFSNNTNNAFDDSSNNWNISEMCGATNILGGNCTGGNFWEDYIYSDANFDGFGDVEYNISGGNSKDYLPLIDIPIISCGVINSNVTIPPGQIITAGVGEDCFTLNASNIVIEGNGATLLGNTNSNTGITGTNVSNITINNLTIIDFFNGINLEGVNYNQLSYNNKITNNIINYTYLGLRILYNDNMNISGNTLYNDGYYGAGETIDIHLMDSANNRFSNNNLSNKLDIYYNSDNNTFVNDMIGNSVRFYDGSAENYFINVTFNKSKLSSEANNYLYVKWYVDVNVTNSSDGSIENVTLNGYDATNILDDTTQTSANGIGTLELTEYYMENNITYYLTNNHLITAIKSGYTQNQSYLNLINTTGAQINLSLLEVFCGMSLNSDFTLGENLYSNGTCLTITGDNIVIDGGDYSIIGNGSGTALSFNNRAGINVSNLNIINFSNALDVYNTNYSNFYSLNLSNSTYGLILNTSNNNKIFDSTFINNQFDLLAINDGGTNNSIVNSSINISLINISGTASIYKKWYVTVNVTNNETTPLQNVNVTAYLIDAGNTVDDTQQTDVDGLAVLEVSELKINLSGITYLNRQNITATYSTASETVINNSVINLSETNNTYLNLSFVLNCTVPSDNLVLTSNTNLCPGTYTINDSDSGGVLVAGADDLVITCDNTIIRGYQEGMGLYNRYIGTNYDNITVIGCKFDNFYYGAYIINSYGHNFINSSFINNYWPGIYFDHVDNVTISGSNFTGNDYGVNCNVGNNWNITNSVFDDNNFYGVYLYYCANSDISYNSLSTGSGAFAIQTLSNNNTFHNNNLTGFSNGIYLLSGTDNLFYHNKISGSSSYHLRTSDGNYFNTSVNVSGNFTAQGNEWDDYCNKGTDSNNDTYADGPTTNTSNDYPYNSTTSSKIYPYSGGYGVDYGPKITTCVTEVQLGSGSGSGSSGSTAVAAAVTTPEVKAPTKTSKSTVVTTDVYSAEDVKKYLKSEAESQQDIGKTVVTFTLENTGKKAIKLFPNILQQVDDPFFIVNTKTMGGEDSAFYNLASLSYSSNSITGRLLQATLVDPEEIIIPPGEKVVRDIEINEGLTIPRQIKIQFTTFGEAVYEKEVFVERTAVSGSAIDLDVENDLMDIYVVLAPEEIFKETEDSNGNSNDNNNGNGNSITGGATVDLSPDLNRYTVEMNINSKDGKKNYFSDLYGPYHVKTQQALVFAQQYKYNPLIYNDEYQIQTKIYKGGILVTENEFNVEMNGGKQVTFKDKLFKVLSWSIPILFLFLCVISIIYFVNKKKGKKKGLKKEEL